MRLLTRYKRYFIFLSHVMSDKDRKKFIARERSKISNIVDSWLTINAGSTIRISDSFRIARAAVTTNKKRQ